MSQLGKQLQFPTRTFHKPNHLKEFTARLGLYACKEQRGKAVAVCLHAPQELLNEYRQLHAPAGAWLKQGWLHAVCDAMDHDGYAADEVIESPVPMIAAVPAEQAGHVPEQGAAAADEQSLQAASKQVITILCPCFDGCVHCIVSSLFLLLIAVGQHAVFVLV